MYFINTKNMSIDDIVSASTQSGIGGNMLLKIKEDTNYIYDLGRICYDCDDKGENVKAVAQCSSNDGNNGKAVEAYCYLVDENNVIEGWHGEFSDGTEPKDKERCYVLLQKKLCNYHHNFRVMKLWYNKKKCSFYGGYEDEYDILGFKHIRENGMAY